MPNGGTDCCAFCVFKGILNEDERNQCKTWTDTYCTIRHELLTRAGYSYCASYHTKCKIPQGPIYCYGYYSEGDYRIPWHEGKEPIVGDSGTCMICSKEYEIGIEIKEIEGNKQFCTSKHYLQWYKDQHPDEILFWDHLKGRTLSEQNTILIYFLDQALELDFENFHAWMKKGVILGGLKKYEEALECFKHSIEINPNDSMAHNNKGYALEKMGHTEVAIISYKKALEINPENETASKNLKNVNSMRKSEKKK